MRAGRVVAGNLLRCLVLALALVSAADGFGCVLGGCWHPINERRDCVCSYPLPLPFSRPLFHSCRESRPLPGPRHVLFVLVDDLGFADAGYKAELFNGTAPPPTPNIDALAKAGSSSFAPPTLRHMMITLRGALQLHAHRARENRQLLGTQSRWQTPPSLPPPTRNRCQTFWVAPADSCEVQPSHIAPPSRASPAAQVSGSRLTTCTADVRPLGPRCRADDTHTQSGWRTV